MTVGLLLHTPIARSDTPARAHDGPVYRHVYLPRLTLYQAHADATPTPSPGIDAPSLVGCRVTETQDFGPDGIVDRLIVTVYGDDDRPKRREVDEDADGAIDAVTEWMYRIDGLLSELRADEDGDSLFELIVSFSYDAFGNRLRQQTAIEGEVTATIAWSYDGHYRVVRQEWDQDADSSPDRIHDYTYGHDGLLVRIDIDVDGDSRIDNAELFSHDADGYLTRHDYDDGADGVVDNAEMYEWSHGLLMRYLHDLGADGQLDSTTRYEYDANERRVLMEVDWQSDGTADDWIRTRYHESGLVSAIVQYRDRAWHDSLTHEYDGEGLVVVSRYESASYGQWVKAYTYACDG